MRCARRTAAARRPVLVGIGVVIVAVVVGVVMFVRGTLGVDQWVVRQVVGIVDRYIVPTFTFERFEYLPPRAVVFDGVTLTAPDGVEVITAGSFRVTLAQTPRIGQPIQIEEIAIDRATLRLLRDLADEGTVFKGLVPFVKREPLRDQSKVPENQRLSTVFKIRSVKVTGGSLEYDAGAGQPPMLVPGLDLDLDVSPVVDETGVVWHEMAMLFDRSPLVRMQVGGRVNLDSLDAVVEGTRVEMRVNAESIRVLPPELQQLLRDADAQGHLDMTARGRVNGSDPKASDIEFDVSLTNFNVAAGEYRLPIDTGRVVVTLRDTTLSVEPVMLNLLGGSLTGQVDASLRPTSMPTQARWSFSGLDLQKLLRTRQEGQPPRIAGTMAGEGRAELDAMDAPRSVRGEGTIALREGRVAAIPVLSDIARVLASGGSTALRDQLDVVFTLGGEAMDISSLIYTSDTVAARGRGKVFYHGGLDLTLNGGPVERVQATLGRLGELLGRVTDGLVNYRVRGTVQQPEVSVHPLGIGS